MEVIEMDATLIQLAHDTKDFLVPMLPYLLPAADAPVGHDNSYDGNFVLGRANLTSVKRYDVSDSSQFALVTAKYNTAGAVVSTRDPRNHEIVLKYADSFSANGTNLDAPRSFATFAFPTTVTDADGNSSFVRYHYDFGAKTRVQGPPPANQSQGLIETFAYDTATRIERVTTANNGAYRRFVYGPNYVQTFASVNTVADEAYSNTVFDGLGRTTGTASLHPGSAGGYTAQITQYDLMGRTKKQSTPAEVTDSWSPAGDDAAGWLYTLYAYDWQGRVTTTTKPDGTAKEASYNGCGCAGGEVVTLTDEGTLVSGLTKKRQQKIYSDIFGRTVKSERLNWDGQGEFGTGGSVYSAVVNDYNSRDQVVSIKQYAGAASPDGSCPSGTCQQTTTTYDGHGRLKTRHIPEQDAGAVTTYNYYADDTVSSVVDARGATQTITYNGRHLPTEISYTAPSGIINPAPVNFSYDSAGNRTSMTDGMGSSSYTHNQLSRLTGEARTFTGLPGSFSLDYAYNLAGQLTSLSDPFGSQIAYNYDEAGRVREVSGTPFGGVSSYASNVDYRAWGALKSLSYGNTKTLAVSYNGALQVSNYEVPGLLKKSYQYNDDGTVKFTQDQLTANSKFDRSYEYDHVGRMTKALTGAEARGQGTTDDRPYHETLAYDQMNHLTTLARQHWDRIDGSGPDTVVNNRIQGWTYDSDGRVIAGSNGSYSYDAAGRVLSFGDAEPYQTDQQFTGDGRRAKTVERRFDDQTDQWVTQKITYYVTSSVLGGALVTELNQQGVKQRTLVYAAGTVLASQTLPAGTEAVEWEHRDAIGASYRSTDSAGQWIGAAEMDPLGANAGIIKPPTWNVPDKEGLPVPHPGMADMINNPGGACVIDRVPIPCEIYANLVRAGATAFDSVATVTITYASGRVETSSGRVNAPAGFDVRFTGQAAQAAGFAFRLGTEWGGFESGLTWAVGNGLAALLGNADGNRLPNGFSFSFAPQIPTDPKINHAFGDAATAITPIKGKKNPCLDFFTQGRTLAEVTKLFQNFWNTAESFPDSSKAVAGTLNSGKDMDARLNLYAPFFADDDITAAGRAAGYIWSPARERYEELFTSLTPRQYRALTILHEFAHALGLIPSDKNSRDQSQKNDDTIFEKCGTILDKRRK
jgi:YD repeat-containing protein